MQKPRIKITKNGPYLVSGLPLSEYEIVVNDLGESVEWRKVRDIAVPENYALCRCGASQNMPFCDGMHKKVDFDGTEVAKRGKYLEMAEKIEGPEYDLLDQKDLCAEARYCAAGKTTWHLVHENDKEPEKRTFLQQCADCPSGRYTPLTKKGKLIEPEFKPEVIIVNDPACAVGGPIWVRGGVEIEAEDGYVFEVRNRVTLCRCGTSKNKPFCDGNHLS